MGRRGRRQNQGGPNQGIPNQGIPNQGIPNQGGPTCLVCKKSGHETNNCWLLKAVNQNQNQQQQNGQQRKGQQQKGQQQQQQPNAKKTCNYCGKVGHIIAECFTLHPELKNKPKGQQQQQQGGGKPRCTNCNKNGHTVDECFKAHPELRGQGGKNKQQQQQETRCTYCLMPNHHIDQCYLLHPELTNPFHHPQQQPPQWAQPADEGNDDNNNKTPPPPRLTQRITQAEAAGLDLTPEGIRHHPKVRRIQGWHPERQTYITLPLYGAAVARPVYHSQSPFAQPTYQVAYEAYDTSGNAVMCTCACPEGFDCRLQQWVRKALDNKPFYFSDRAEEGFGRIMQDGLVDTADIAMIY